MAYDEHRGFNRGRGNQHASSTKEDLELLVGGPNGNESLHIANADSKNANWNLGATTNPTVYIHSAINPVTEYLSFHNSSTAGVINCTGSAINLQQDGARVAVFGTGVTQIDGNLNVDQAALDTNAFSLRSSDVATVLTTIVLGPDVTTEDFFSVGKASATLGGAYVQAMAGSTATEALHIDAWGGAPATTDASTSLAAINIFAGEHNGANADADMAADSNALAVGEIDSAGARQTRLLLKADDGELHLGNATPAALDAENDVMLIREMQKASTNGGIIETIYDDNPFYDYNKLRELGIVGEKDESGFHLFALQPRLSLHEGAMWQIYTDMQDMAKALPDDVKERLPERLKQKALS